jgi:hypothetical protein
MDTSTRTVAATMGDRALNTTPPHRNKKLKTTKNR